MYTWSRQQLLELQAKMNREMLLRSKLDNSPSDQSMFRRHQNLPLLQPTVPMSDSAATLRLQAKLDALKRQNQDAISNLLAKRQLDDSIYPTNTVSHVYGVFDPTGLAQERNQLLNNASIQKRHHQDGMIQGITIKSESFEKQKEDFQHSDTKKKHLAVLEAEYSDPRPKRPLSAYNVFFQEQRQQILDDPIKSSGEGLQKADGDMSKPSSTGSLTETTVATVQSESDECPKKRKRYEPHHKMSFESMAKTIAKRWKETVSDEIKMRPYQDVAKVEKERYVKELAQWKQRRRQRLHNKC